MQAENNGGDIPFYADPILSEYDFLQEEMRFSTFVDWPVSFVDPRELARNGLYYLRVKDYCACVSCRKIIGKWKRGKKQREEHLKHSPDCKFTNGKRSKWSFLKKRSPEQSNRNRSYYKFHYHENIVIGSDVSERRFNLPVVDPFVRFNPQKVNEYILQNHRLATFDLWPETVEQTPKEMAVAGFYSAQSTDHVFCFYCGGGLRNWRRGGDPWVEHARWYPKCVFVRNVKGYDFINEIQKQWFSPIPFATTTLEGSISTTGSSSSSSSSSSSNRVPSSDRNSTSSSSSSSLSYHTPLSSSPSSKNGEERDTKHPFMKDVTCKICLDEEMSIAFLPCRHMSTCSSCAAQLSLCPICRAKIKNAIKPIIV